MASLPLSLCVVYVPFWIFFFLVSLPYLSSALTVVLSFNSGLSTCWPDDAFDLKAKPNFLFPLAKKGPFQAKNVFLRRRRQRGRVTEWFVLRTWYLRISSSTPAVITSWICWPCFVRVLPSLPMLMMLFSCLLVAICIRKPVRLLSKQGKIQHPFHSKVRQLGTQL